MRIEWLDEFVVKVAESDEESVRLGHEEAVLRAVAHPAVVRVAAAERAETGRGVIRLSLHRVRGVTLAEAGDQPEELVAGWGAAVATVVADLHDLGYVHGAIAAEHVLVDEMGRPILCGFGRAARISDVGGDALAADVRAVSRLVEVLLPSDGGRLGRTVRHREGRCARRSNARRLAQAIVDRVPGAVVRPVGSRDGPVGGDPPVPTGDDHPVEAADMGAEGEAGSDRGGPEGARRAARLSFVGAGLAVLLAAGAWATVASTQSPSPPRRGGGTRYAPAPFSAYLMGAMPGEDPITVVGNWGCGPSRAAVLDTRSGTLWAFPAWPTRGGTVTGTFVRHVPGATGLAAVSDGDACDQLLVLRAGQPDVAVDPGAGGR